MLLKKLKDLPESSVFCCFLGVVFILFTYGVFVKSLIRGDQSVGTYDWRSAFCTAEVMRVTLLKFHQMPWWNPYSSGGVPLLAASTSTGSGLLTLSMPIILLFGSVAGIKIALLLYMIFGFMGAYLLAGMATSVPLFRMVAGLLFVCNGGIVSYFGPGHYLADYPYYPWIVYFTLRAIRAQSKSEVAKYSITAGVFFGLLTNALIHYSFVFVLMTFFLLMWLAPATRLSLKRWISQGALTLGGYLSLAGMRLALGMVAMHDFPRIELIESHYGLKGLAWAFMRKGLVGDAIPEYAHASHLHWWELGLYVGVVPVVLFLYSLISNRGFRNLRFYHWMVLLILVFIYSSRFPYPYYWLSHYVPPFKTMRVATRFRIWMIPFFSWAVVDGLNRVRSWKRGPALATLLCFVIALDLSTEGRHILAPILPARKSLIGTRVETKNEKLYPVTVRETNPVGDSREPKTVDPENYAFMQQNYAVIPGHVYPINDYLAARTPKIIFGINDPEYRGEFYTSKGPVEPAYWSPNHIVFKDIHEPLRLNMNPGSYWRVNGKALYSQLRVADYDYPFIVNPDENGTIDLKVVPKGLPLGTLLTLIGFALLLFRNRISRFIEI